ncbi:serine protease [Parerythrobacter aurantius]|uniref:serine protease n=1 Tax=Parerythrobacter aurantius TaxID=3127706 RepID=UPI0032484677
MRILMSVLAAILGTICALPLAAQEPGPTGPSIPPPQPAIENSPQPAYIKTRVRVSEEIGERRAEIIAFIERQPGWKVEEPAEFEVVPNPEYFEELLFSPIKRYSFDRTGESRPSEAKDIAEIMLWNDPRLRGERFEGPDKAPYPIIPKEPEWGLEIPLPVSLGLAEGPELLPRLAAAIAPIARHHSLLGVATDQWLGMELCVTNIRPSGWDCPLSGNSGTPVVMFREPIYIQGIADGLLDPALDTVTFVAIAPNREVIPLYSAPVTQLVRLAGEATKERRFTLAGDPDQPVRLTRMGLYHVMALVSAGPVDPRIWTLAPGDEPPAGLCDDPVADALCAAMQGRYDVMSDPPLYASAATVSVSSDQIFARLPVGGGRASLAEGRWQAQLFLPRAGDPLGVSGDPSPGGAQRQNFEKSHKCGGSYLGDGFVLTAAHCVDKRKVGELQVRLGTLDIAAGGSNFPIVSMVVHQDYGKSPGNADIALLRIKPDSRLDTLLRKGLLGTIDLAPSGERLADGTDVLITGWGFTGATTGQGTVDSAGRTQRNARFLAKVAMKTHPASFCLKFEKLRNFAAADIVCAKSPEDGKDACFGDSGGPLTRLVGGKRILVGIVAAGIGCAQPGTPGVYTRVANFRSWIEQAKRAAMQPGRHVVSRNGRVVG